MKIATLYQRISVFRKQYLIISIKLQKLVNTRVNKQDATIDEKHFLFVVQKSFHLVCLLFRFHLSTWYNGNETTSNVSHMFFLLISYRCYIISITEITKKAKYGKYYTLALEKEFKLQNMFCGMSIRHNFLLLQAITI